MAERKHAGSSSACHPRNVKLSCLHWNRGSEFCTSFRGVKQLDIYQCLHKRESRERPTFLFFFQDLLERYSKLIQQLADVDSKDTSSTLSIHTATLSRALQKKNSYDPIGSLHSGSNGSLNHALDVSGNWASLGSSLGEEDPDSFSSSMTSLSLKRRMTRSRSLDDMLDVNTRQKRASKKATSKRRVGSSKFYTEQILNVINKGKYLSLPFFFSDHCSHLFPRHG